MSDAVQRGQFVGRGICLPGNDIDTDRIIPARFLKCVTFEGLDEHVFEDDRLQTPDHPFNQKRFKGATVLIVGHNFGCGSSREHAPEALRRWGIQVIVGKSFAEIFIGNCTALGIPCLTLSEDDLDWLIDAVQESPEAEVLVDIKGRRVQFGDRTLPANISDARREQLLRGTWNAMMVLLEAGDAIDMVASRLPYLSGYPADPD